MSHTPVDGPTASLMLSDPADSAVTSCSTETNTAVHPQQAAFGVSLNTPSRRRNKPGESLSRRERGRRRKVYTSFNSLPKELQSNQYIVSGYRLQLSAWESIKSVFGLHNETGNIWSHLLGQCLALTSVAYVLQTHCQPVSASDTHASNLQGLHCSWC